MFRADRRGLGRLTALCAVALSIAILTGCHNMYDQPKYLPLESSTLFADNSSARPQLPDTIAQGQARTGDPMLTGISGGKPVTEMPVPVTDALVARGNERFHIFCAPCHGASGEGDGTVVKRGFSAPPSLKSDAFKQAPVGHFFDVISNGFGKMPPYNLQVPVQDRWAIVAYIRQLQSGK